MAREWFTEWVNLLGRTTVDDAVINLLRELGVTEVPKISGDDFEARIYSSGLVLVFHDAEMYPKHPGGGRSGVGILKEVDIFPESDTAAYEGPLPYGLERSDGRTEVAGKLGTPTERNIRRKRDSWTRDGIELRVKYSGAEDDAPIEAICAMTELVTGS